MPISRAAIPNTKGVWAEKIAAQFLQSRGYHICAMQARTRIGEIDIVAQQGATTIFVEVKMRTCNRTGQAEAAVGYAKQLRLARAMHVYIQRHKLAESALRFDVMVVYEKARGVFGIRHYSNVPLKGI